MFLLSKRATYFKETLLISEIYTGYYINLVHSAINKHMICIHGHHDD